VHIDVTTALRTLGSALAPLGATLLSSAVYGAAFPPIALRPLAWFALIPLFVALRRVRSREALLLAWLWTMAAAYAVGDWFPRAVSVYYFQPILIGVLFFAGVSSIMAAPFYVAFAACYRRLARRAGATLPLLAAAAWTAGEFGRTTLFTGNPWALFGYSQAGVAPVVQIVDVTGVYGVTFVLVAVNAALAEAWLALHGSLRLPAAVVAGLALAASTVAVDLGYGRMRLAERPSSPMSGGTKIAIVQGNLDLGSQWRPELYGRNLDAYMRLTADALRTADPPLVFWPESAMTFFLDDEPLYRTAIARVLVPSGAQLVAGSPRFAGEHDARIYYNTAYLLSSEGIILGWYDKQRLLPFAEYFPFRSIELLRRRFARVREFTPGASTALLATAAGPAGVVICNEAVFPEIAAARVQSGATFLVNLSNDTWVSDPTFSEQLFDMVTMRAIEQRRYFVRASTSGFSAIIDPWGHPDVLAPPFTQTWIGGWVFPREGITVYGRVGDLFALACTAVALGTAVTRRRTAGMT
jgi:apolipoprotein N-acyltransferase